MNLKKKMLLILLILFTFLMINSVSALDANATSTDVIKNYDDSADISSAVSYESKVDSKIINKINSSDVKTVSEKESLDLKINPIKDIAFSEKVEVNGKLNDVNGNSITNTVLNVNLNNKTSTTTKTNTNGEFSFSNITTIPGLNNITISYNGNDYYSKVSKSATFNVLKRNLTGTIESVKYESNNNLIVTGKLNDLNSKPITNTDLKIIAHNQTITGKTNAKGEFVCSGYADLSEEDTLKIEYSGNDYYNYYTTTQSINNPDIRLGDYEIHPGTTATFLALIPYDLKGNAVFKINQKTISDKLELNDGMILYSYTIPSDYKSEEYLLELAYSGDEKYIAKTVNATLTLTPEGGRVSPAMNIKNYTITYQVPSTIIVEIDKDAFGTVNLKANGTNITSIKFSNGTIKYNYVTNLTAGKYNLTAEFDGNYKYLKKTVNSTLTVNKIKTNLSMKDFSSKAGSYSVFVATLTDENKKAVPNVKVSFKMNNLEIGSNVTDKNGVVKLYYTLPSSLYNKTYNITATSDETNTTLSTTGKCVLRLTQLNTSVSVPAISTKPSKTVIITATVVDQFKNYVTKGVVTFKKENTVLGTVNVSNGFAKFTYSTNYETSPKVYIYASYVGDWKYASSNGKGTFEVTQLKTTISPSAVDAKPNSAVTLKALVRDQNLNYATAGKVKFTLNNSVIGTVNVKNGVASLSYTLKGYPAGKYRIKAEYLGSTVYKACSNTNTMTVSRYQTTIKGDELTAVVGSKSTITVNVIDDEKYNVNSGQVKYYVNNVYVGTASVKNGVATLKYNVPSQFDGKTVKYYVSYVKNGIYDSSSYSNNLVVTHQKTVYVSPNGNDKNLGDKAHPFKTISHALTHISLFGTVKLEAGNYSVSGLKLNTSVNIIGSGRFITFIDGKNSGVPVFNITKRNAVLTLRGVTIRNAKSNGQFSAGAIVTSGKLNIINSRFANNTGTGAFSGGAIYTNGILNITNSEFINNKVTNVNSQGGAIRCYDNQTYITDCKFDSNKVTGTNSTGASAIYGDNSDIIINKTTFTKNTAKGKYITGGTIRVISGALVISDSTFKNNTVTATDYAMGGIIGSLSSGVSIIKTNITSNTIKGTNSAGGSAIYVETAALDVKDSKINSNKLSGKNTYGGIIYSYKANVNSINNEIKNNILTNTENGYGGAIYTYNGEFNITNTKFTNNTIKAKTLALGGAIYSNSKVVIRNSNFEKNNINASNLGGGAIANMGNLTVKQSNFINNNAVNAGNAITATNTAKNNIENNYWGASSPKWSDLLYSVSKPKAYYKSKV